MRRTALKSTVTTAALVAAVVFAVPAFAQRDKLSLSERVARLEQQPDTGNQNPGALTDMVLKLNQIEQEMRDLRGLMEDQAFEIENLKNAQRDQYLDLDRRLTQGQSGTGGVASSGLRPSGFPAQGSARDTAGRLPAPGPGSTGVTQSDPNFPAQGTLTQVTPVHQDFPELAEPVDAQLQSSGLGQVALTEIAALVDPAAEKADYNTAFDALKAGRYAEAARLFAVFVERYPNGDYSDNAQYWLAESYYVTGNYRIALDAFQNLINRFPGSPKIPDGKLKLGYTYFSLKDWRQAETVLNEVIAQYPNSTVSRLAENQLRTMRIQGNIQ
jgi:tol-pal system protein YbgF